ncbi:MAG TPA: hypothetical protein VKT75_04705 [Acidobacteriaceae bacterium]|nr:hypothetical protein [Acidobacteriaceae bacterium]
MAHSESDANSIRGPGGWLLCNQSGHALFAVSLSVDFLFLLLLFGSELDLETEFAELAGGDIEGAAAILVNGGGEANPDGASPECIVALEAGRRTPDPVRRIWLLRQEGDAHLNTVVAGLNVETDGGWLILGFGL